MKQVTIHIPDDKYSFIMELISQLGLKTGEVEEPIAEWQKEKVLERMKKSEQDPDRLLDWDDVKDSFRLDS